MEMGAKKFLIIAPPLINYYSLIFDHIKATHQLVLTGAG
jgi:hypothetical protein